MVWKITVSILALIGWNLVEWTGNEGKLLKLGELWAIKRSVLRRPLPFMREKKSDASFLWSSLWEGKGGKASFRLLWWVERCQKDLRWLRYGQSEPRKTSAGSAMTKVVPDWPPLTSLWPKWSQIDLCWLRYDQSGPRLTSAGFAMTKVVPDWPLLASLWPKWSQIDLVWHHYDQSGPRKRWTWSGSNTFEMKSTLSGWSLLVCSLCMTLSNISSERLPIRKGCFTFPQTDSPFSLRITLFIVMSRTNGLSRCGCVRFDSLDWAGPAVAMMGCGRRKKSQHFANSLGEIQSFILIKASSSVIIHEGSLRT